MAARYARWMLLLLSGSAGLGATAHETATRDDLERALAQLEFFTNQYFDHPRAAKTQAYIDQAHARIRELAHTAPDDRRLAHVIFRRGLSSRQLEQMSREFHLAVHEAQLRFLDPEKDFEGSVPMQIFWRGNDSSLQVLDRSIADYRKAFAARAAEARKNPDLQAQRAAKYFDRLAKDARPVLVSVGVTAKSDMLRLASEEPDVYVVVMDPSADTVRRLDQMRDNMPGQTRIQDITEPR